VAVTDDNGGQGVSTVPIVVYDPTAGFVTGGGTINSPPGAYVDNPMLTGRASFGFVCRYDKDASVPSGETEFNFAPAHLRFHSASYQWLVIAGGKAQYRGAGEPNGVAGYTFLLTVGDGQLLSGDGVDRFRLKILEDKTGRIVYDNKMGAPDDIDSSSPQPIATGSIVIHKKLL